MKLPIPFKKESQDKNEYYLALILTDERANAVILEEYQNQLKIIGNRCEYFLAPLETLSLDDIIAVVDKTISKAEEVLPPSIETHKTVFCVKESWIENETKKIKKEYLEKLKKLCNVLDLQPLGFMVLNEAISNYLQKKEGAPMSAILATIGHKLIIATLFRGGKVVEKYKGIKEHTAVVSVDKLLTHFTVPVLPARIVILDVGNNDNLSQQFIHHHWSKSLPFLHIPQITLLPEGFDSLAVAYGAAVQMGFDIQEDTSLNFSSAEQIDETEDQENTVDPLHSDSLVLPTKNDQKESDFGFLINQDINDLPKDQENESAPERNFTPTDTESTAATDESLRDVDEPEQPNQDETDDDADHVPKKNILVSFLTTIRPNFTSFHFPKRLGLIIPIIVLCLVVIAALGLIYVYLYKTHATITLLVSPKIVDQPKNTVTFSTGVQNNFSKNIIQANSVSASVNGSVSTNSTGQKETGNKALGTVTIYNSTDSDQTINSGTTLTSSNNLAFTTTSDATIASASGDIFSGTKPGTTDVNVEAADYGTDYNLPSGTTFSVSGNSNLAGKNNDAFSGGSKSSEVVVSETDIANVRASLAKRLQSQGLSALSQKASGSESVLPVLTGETISNPSYDNNVGAEASKVTLSATVVFTGLSYKASDLNNYAQTVLKTNNSQNANFANNSIKVDIENAKEIDGNDISADVTVHAGILPTINSQNIIAKIQNISLSKAKSDLLTLPQVTNSVIQFKPNIPILPDIFPRLPKNITIVIQPND